MRYYRTADVAALAATHPAAHREAFARGRFSRSRVYVEVPDGLELPLQPLEGSLGDAVAAFAQPVARALDKVVGTHLSGCGGCKDRQDRLNGFK